MGLGGSPELREWVKYFSQFKCEDDGLSDSIAPIDDEYKIDYWVMQLAGDFIKDENWIWDNITYNQVIKRGLLGRYRDWATEERRRLYKQTHNG